MARLRLLTFCCLVLAAPAAAAGRLEVPLRIPLDLIQQAIGAQVYREGPCRYLKVETPKLDALDGQLRFAAPGSAALGVELFGNCQNGGAWRGTMHFTLAPRIDGAGRLRMRIVDSKVTGAGLIWDLSKRYVHPRLERFSYDLGASREALQTILRSAAPPEHAAALELALTQLELLEPRVETTHIVVPVAIEIPDAWLAAPPPASTLSAPLTEAELEALDQALLPWDAFLAYSIKQLALDNEDRALRQRLFTLLIDSRYQLAAIVSGEMRTIGDPVRALFIDAWNEMREILADARYTLFLDAGDALMALDSAAPGLGMTLSADGLRQLARSLRPGAADDALAYDWSVDPQLARLFDVEDIPKPEPLPPGRSWLDLFIPTAHATTAATEKPPLDPWVPTRSQLAAYETRVGDLLRRTSAIELRRANLAAPYDRIYRHLMPTTALIESCWRQYELRSGKVSYLRSAAGSVGIMQINQRVWRGFYDVERLRWDTAYNIRAGAQILMRYLKDYAIPYAERTGDPNHVPRAAYAVYNAGPRAVGRFNKVPRHPREERVDERLWTLYEGIASGGRADLRSCSVISASARNK